MRILSQGGVKAAWVLCFLRGEGVKKSKYGVQGSYLSQIRLSHLEEGEIWDLRDFSEVLGALMEQAVNKSHLEKKTQEGRKFGKLGSSDSLQPFKKKKNHFPQYNKEISGLCQHGQAGIPTIIRIFQEIGLMEFSRLELHWLSNSFQ